MTSRVPEFSPEATRLQNRSSKCLGCFASANARPPPADTSLLICPTSLFIAGLSRPSCTISKLCTRGTPAFIMVAICRENIEISAGFMPLPMEVKSGLDFFLTDLADMPCLRSCAFANAWLVATISPWPFWPFLLSPLHTKVMFVAIPSLVSSY